MTKLDKLAPDWPVAANVTAFTTKRSGGVSQPPFNSLNLALHVGDEPNAVSENRQRLVDGYCLPSAPVWLNQTHSSVISEINDNSNVQHNADGAFTRIPNTVLAVLTADCLPVVISNDKGTELAVVHAGWRGLADGILSTAMTHFDQAAQIHAWLGPAIGPQRFEVGEEVLDIFATLRKDNAAHFTATNTHGKFMGNLYAIAHAELTRAGCTTVSGGQYCTHSQSDWFHSHRRDGAASGRMATVAWISPS